MEELHGPRLSDDRGGTRRVRVNGKALNITLGLEMVSVTMDFGRADAALLDMVAAHLDAAIGSGKYDALFRAPARSSLRLSTPGSVRRSSRLSTRT